MDACVVVVVVYALIGTFNQELYNEELSDLLGANGENLKIFDDLNRKGINVHGLEEISVNCAQDIYRILESGFQKRISAETNLNRNSR